MEKNNYLSKEDLPGCSDLSAKLYSKQPGHFLNVDAGCLSSIKSMEALSSYIHGILDGSGLFERYFIHLTDGYGNFRHIYDFKSAAFLEADYAGILTGTKGFRNIQSTEPNENNPLKVFSVTDATAKDRVEPWMFLLQRMGIKEIVALYLDFGGNGIGIFWYLPANSNYKIPNIITALLSGAIGSFQQIQQTQIKIPLTDQSFIHNDQPEPAHLEESNKVMIGTGPGMQKLNLLIDKVAPSYATVLILGETGTGKELVANEIHVRSERKDMPFVKVNCAALPLHLIESELFGHEKGSFTGATDKRLGKFELANGGTLFLDEIGEMDSALQVKLLRVLQEKEIERVGASKSIKVNVRIIAATSRDLQAEVTQGRFRSDLYYRLNVFSIPIPPLRERMEDLTLLCDYFLNKHARDKTPVTLSPHAFKQIAEYHWPGNVRELEHFIERSILVAEGQVLKALYLPEKEEHSAVPRIETHFKTFEEMESDHLKDALRLSLGKISGKNGAAALLGFPPSTLASKLLRLKIDKDEFLYL